MKRTSFWFLIALLAVSGAVAAWISPAALVQPQDCDGDCDGSHSVTVDELLIMVNIALENMHISTCDAGDTNGDDRITIDEILAAVSHALNSCEGAPTPSRTLAPTPTPTRLPTMTSELELFDVGPTFFSIRKPQGWDIHIAGVCTTLGIVMRDPAVPLRQIFYFSLIGPVYLKEAQRQIDLDYINSGGYNLITWLDAPAVDPLTTENFFAHWPTIADMDAAVAYMPQFPKLTGLTVAASTLLSPMLPTGDSALVRAVFMENGLVGQGQFLGTVWVFSPFTGMPAGGTAYGSILLGVTAPKQEFNDVAARLVASLESFTVTQGYIDWCIAQQRQLWGAVARAGQTLSETSDMIFEGWQNRSRSSDIMAEKSADALRGIERVYDPGANQVYEVPANWYANYDIHRGDYTMNNLQLLPADSYELWMAAPADGNGIY